MFLPAKIQTLIRKPQVLPEKFPFVSKCQRTISSFGTAAQQSPPLPQSPPPQRRWDSRRCRDGQRKVRVVSCFSVFWLGAFGTSRVLRDRRLRHPSLPYKQRPLSLSKGRIAYLVPQNYPVYTKKRVSNRTMVSQIEQLGVAIRRIETVFL